MPIFRGTVAVVKREVVVNDALKSLVELNRTLAFIPILDDREKQDVLVTIY